jgi:hypothetical protein
MSTKNYIVIAGIIKDHAALGAASFASPEAMRESIASDLAEYFKSDNERFDIPKFIAACGV